ncbi:MAG: hypothetical protein AAB886_02635, partial [Patescibacteria group bacterium]
MPIKHKQAFRPTLNPIANVVFAFQEPTFGRTVEVIEREDETRPAILTKINHTPSPYTISIISTEPAEDIFEKHPNNFLISSSAVGDTTAERENMLNVSAAELLEYNCATIPCAKTLEEKPCLHKISDLRTTNDYLNDIVCAADKLQYDPDEDIPTIDDVAESYTVESAPIIKHSRKTLRPFLKRGAIKAAAV